MPLTAMLVAAALAGPVRFERVEILAENPATWVNYELPMAASNTTTSAVRLLEQTKVVWATKKEGLRIGTSLRSQSVQWEGNFWAEKSLVWSAGAQTRFGLPNGAFGSLGWRWRRLRLSAGVSVLSGATWARPAWDSWRVLPVVSVGFGRSYRP
jgi:hypothetical protein